MENKGYTWPIEGEGFPLLHEHLGQQERVCTVSARRCGHQVDSPLGWVEFLSCFSIHLQWKFLHTMQDTEQSFAPDAPARLIEEDIDVVREASTSDFKQTKVELSPKYNDILAGYLRLRDDPKFKARQYYRFVARLDPEISLRNFETWVQKLKRNEERERQVRIKNFATTTLTNATTIEAIRDGAIKVFYLKVTEFLKNPDMLDKMTFRDALNLYEKIERLHIATKELNLKERDQTRKDVFTLFSIKAMAGDVDTEQIDAIQSATYGSTPQRPTLPGA